MMYDGIFNKTAKIQADITLGEGLATGVALDLKDAKEHSFFVEFVALAGVSLEFGLQYSADGVIWENIPEDNVIYGKVGKTLDIAKYLALDEQLPIKIGNGFDFSKATKIRLAITGDSTVTGTAKIVAVLGKFGNSDVTEVFYEV